MNFVVGKWRSLGGNGKWGKNMIKIYHMKFLKNK